MFDLVLEIAAIVEAAHALDRASLPLADEIAVSGLIDALTDVSRHFAVMRCNHCEDAPCVTICPTSALFHRDDGIVDFDTASCIGCKSCMNACPYDALYIDPAEHTAQKCNFCAHRVEVGLQPSCVVVCPTQSIIAGDLDDVTSTISQLIASHDVAVRAPEQGTRPRLFYKGAAPEALDPTATAIAADGMIWAETTPSHPTLPTGAADVPGRTAYTTAHPAPWGRVVVAYLVTKSIAAGALMIGALYVLLGHAGAQAPVGVLPLDAPTAVRTLVDALFGSEPDLHSPVAAAALLGWGLLGAVVTAATVRREMTP